MDMNDLKELQRINASMQVELHQCLYTAQSFESAYKGQCKTKVVESGKAYCSQCGTTTFMDSKECKAPSDHTPDWTCALISRGVAVGVLA